MRSAKKKRVDHPAACLILSSALHPRFKRPIIMADAQLPFAACLEFLAQRVPQHLRQPKVGIICGSGLSTLAASLTDTTCVPYGEIPGFGISTGALSSKIAKCKKLIPGGCSSRAEEQSGLWSLRRRTRRGDVGEGKRLGGHYSISISPSYNLIIPVPRLRRLSVPKDHVSGPHYG